MQFTLLFLIFVPLIEIYFMIKIGAFIGAFNTIMATLLTAGIGLYFVRQQGLATVYSALNSIERNNSPIFEVEKSFSKGYTNTRHSQTPIYLFLCMVMKRSFFMTLFLLN